MTPGPAMTAALWSPETREAENGYVVIASRCGREIREWKDANNGLEGGDLPDHFMAHL